MKKFHISKKRIITLLAVYILTLFSYNYGKDMGYQLRISEEKKDEPIILKTLFAPTSTSTPTPTTQIIQKTYVTQIPQNTTQQDLYEFKSFNCQKDQKFILYKCLKNKMLTINTAENECFRADSTFLSCNNEKSRKKIDCLKACSITSSCNCNLWEHDCDALESDLENKKQKLVELAEEYCKISYP